MCIVTFHPRFFFAAVAGRKIFWVLWLRFKIQFGFLKATIERKPRQRWNLEFVCSRYTVSTEINPYENTFAVFRVLSLFPRFWLILFAFFPPSTIWPSTCGQINCHALAAKAHRLSCGNGLFPMLEAQTQTGSRLKLPRTMILPQNIEERLERDIDLSRAKVKLWMLLPVGRRAKSE